MRTPFIKRESEAKKQARITAEEAQFVAKTKAPKRFWFKVKFVIVGVIVAITGVIAAFVSLIGGLIYLGRNAPPSSGEARSSPPAVSRPSEPRPVNTGNKPYKESVAEKLYEKATGKEVVHRKDGTTYERKQPKKR